MVWIQNFSSQRVNSFEMFDSLINKLISINENYLGLRYGQTVRYNLVLIIDRTGAANAYHHDEKCLYVLTCCALMSARKLLKVYE